MHSPQMLQVKSELWLSYSQKLIGTANIITCSVALFDNMGMKRTCQDVLYVPDPPFLVGSWYKTSLI